MAQEPQDNNPTTPDFDDRHKEELGVKRFATLSAINFVVPLAAAGIAGVAGYFTLGKPIKYLFPKVVKITDFGTNLASAFGRAKEVKGEEIKGIMDKLTAEFGDILSSNTELKQKFEQQTAHAIDGGLKDAATERPPLPTFEINLNLNGAEKKPDPLGLDGLMSTLKDIGQKITDPERQAKFYEIIGVKRHDTSKWWGAGGAAFLGSAIGGTAINYNEWKKEESARLAAGEVNRDISNIELFRPSDPELTAENKRLRAMLAEKDAHPAPVAAPAHHAATPVSALHEEHVPETKVLHEQREPHGKIHHATAEQQLG